MSDTIERHAARLADALVDLREARADRDELRDRFEAASDRAGEAFKHVRKVREQFESFLERTWGSGAP